ncbi:metalloregulator ArsR/SmtB family transcription factor [Kordia algicida OT-1]|uniref:Transcriptional regulator, ArsR family protein n=1 Tax=Kordia algicida OT-1 TaxID=391587 RepID=A9DUJ1_9FLAO|nr:metalloregulator ArsR/SmtB family transcription factor [Kordia algicida]EDP96297.1 transcriptional regulator, ArsR family protein [Kordia algicida OT-1]
MGITKTIGFSEEITAMADTLKVLGHPARLSIMHYLANTPSCICNDIVMELPLAQPTISRHLSELKRVGLIQGEISGKNICYCINSQKWQEVLQYLETITISLSNAKKC